MPRPKVIPYETRDDRFMKRHNLTTLSVDRETVARIAAYAKDRNLSHRLAVRELVSKALGETPANNHAQEAA